MALQPGEHIGPYEILAPLGRGGMGNVYRARDTRLRREVALKVLVDTAANDAESLARFEREARAVAALNHPNIVAIHDIGTVRGVPFAVTELLEGETLGERLRSGPLAPKRATEIACQIAEGLAAAHAKGVIHRDIKPDNIFLTHDGRAKILDFGIARIEKHGPQGSVSPDVSLVGQLSRSSGQVLIGTAGYISPEQVRGKRADTRSDVFALGAVCYEMLTARRAFDGPTPVEALASVLRENPARYPETAGIPEELRRFVLRCLEKDPADRWQSVRDLLLDLRAYQAEGIRESARRVRFRSVPPWRLRRTRIALRAAGGILLLLLGIFLGTCWERTRHTQKTPAQGIAVSR